MATTRATGRRRRRCRLPRPEARRRSIPIGYNAAGWTTSETDALGNVTTTAYDADGRVTSVTAPVPATGVAAPVTHYTYDHLGRVTSVETDPDSHTTSYGYNSLNQKNVGDRCARQSHRLHIRCHGEHFDDHGPRSRRQASPLRSRRTHIPTWASSSRQRTRSAMSHPTHTTMTAD